MAKSNKLKQQEATPDFDFELYAAEVGMGGQQPKPAVTPTASAVGSTAGAAVAVRPMTEEQKDQPAEPKFTPATMPEGYQQPEMVYTPQVYQQKVQQNIFDAEIKEASSNLQDIGQFVARNIYTGEGKFQPISLNSEQAAEYGIDIDPDSTIDITLPSGGLYVSPEQIYKAVDVTLTMPDGWGLTSAGNFVSPDNEIFTPIEMQQAGKFQGALSSVFSGMAYSDVVETYNTSQEEFWGRIAAVGRSEQTEYILRTLGVDRYSQAAIFGEPAPIPWEEQAWSVTQQFKDTFTLKSVANWAGKEDIAEVLYPALAQVADTAGISLAGFGAIMDVADRYVFFPWRLAFAEAVTRLQDPLTLFKGITDPTQLGRDIVAGESSIFKSYDEMSLVDRQLWAAIEEEAKKNGVLGYVVSEGMMEAYDRWQHDRGWTGTAAYWVAELTNPIFWIPVGGVATRGASLFSRVPVFGKAASGTAKGIVALEKGVTYPLVKFTEGGVGVATKGAKFVMNKVLNKEVPIYKLPSNAETLFFVETNHPGRLTGTLDKAKSIFNIGIDDEGYIQSIVNGGKLISRQADEIGAAAGDMVITQLEYLTKINPSKILDIKGGTISNWGKGTTGIIGYKEGAPMIEGVVSRAWGDVFEYADKYVFADPRVYDWIKLAHKAIDDVVAEAARHGVVFDKRILTEAMHYFPRGSVKGLAGVFEDDFVRVGATLLGSKTTAMKHRVFEFMDEGIKAGYKYADPVDALRAYIHSVYRYTGNQQAINLIKESQLELLKPLLKETPEGFAAIARAELTRKEAAAAEKLELLLQRIRRGETPHPSTMRWVRNKYPELSDRIEQLAGLKETTADKTLVDALINARNRISGARKARGGGGEVFDRELEKLRLAGIGTNKLETAFRNYKSLLDSAAPIAERDRAWAEVLDTLNPSHYKRVTTPNDALFKELQSEARLITAEAKVTALEAAGIKSEMAERAGTAALTEGRVDIPAFRNRIFQDVTVNGKRITGKEVAGLIEGAFKQKAPRWIEEIAKANRGLVTLTAALDSSAPFIQGVYTLGLDLVNLLHGRPTAIWARTFAEQLYVMLNPKYVGAFRGKHAATYLANPTLLTGSHSDFMAGIPFLKNTIGRIPVAGKAVMFPYGRTSLGFEAWGEMARVLIVESLERSWLKGGGTRMELAEFANMMTGVISSKSIGVGATQRAAESAALFAPRYFRANLMFLRSFMRGGMTGKMAIEVIAGTAAAWVAAYSAISAGMGQDPKLNPLPKGMGGDGSEFLTVKIGDQYIGMPGFLYSFVKLFGGVIATLSQPENYNKLFTIDFNELMRYHPEFRWLMYKTSPLVSTGAEMLNGRDILGYRLDTTQDYMEQVYENFLSIALQSIITQDPPGSAVSFAMEVFGLRTFPQSLWEKFNDTADEIIFGMPQDFFSDNQREKMADGRIGWGDLDTLQQKKLLEQYPNLLELQQQAITESNRRSTDEWLNWGAANDGINTDRDTSENNQVAKLKDPAQDFNIVDLRNAISDIALGIIGRRTELENQYPNIYAEFEKNRADKLEDAENFAIAEDEWYNYVLYGQGTTDINGDIMWNVVNARRNEWMAKWGEDMFADIMEYKEYGYEGRDPLLFRIWQGKQLVWDYWQILDDKGEPDAEARMEFRRDEDNLDIEANLVFLGYVSTIATPFPDAENDAQRAANWERVDIIETAVKEWATEFGVELTDIPYFSKWIISEEAMAKFGITDEYAIRTLRALPQSHSYQSLYLLEHPELYNYWTTPESEGGLGHEILERHIESYRIDVRWAEQDEAYDAVTGGTQQWRDGERLKILTDNSDYRIDRWKRDAYDDGFKDSIIDDYAAYKEAGWGGDDDAYDAEWLLIADKNAGFDNSGGSALYEEMFRTGKFTDRARQDKILSNVPTPHVEDLYVNLYKSFPAYDPGRMATRCQYPELQAWGAKKFGWKAADCGDSQQITPYEYPDEPYGGVTIP